VGLTTRLRLPSGHRLPNVVTNAADGKCLRRPSYIKGIPASNLVWYSLSALKATTYAPAVGG